MIIRPLASRDIPLCTDIYRLAFGERVARKAFLEMAVSLRVEETHINYYVAFDKGVLIGSAGMQATNLLSGIYDFIFIAVHPEHQGKQVGRALTEYRIAEVDRREGRAIHTITSKPGFFRKFGFKTAYSSNGLTMMHKQLRPLEL